MQRACQRRPVTSYGSSRGPSITITSCLALSYTCSNTTSRRRILLVVARTTKRLPPGSPGVSWDFAARVRVGRCRSSTSSPEERVEEPSRVVSFSHSAPDSQIGRAARPALQEGDPRPAISIGFLHGFHHPSVASATRHSDQYRSTSVDLSLRRRLRISQDSAHRYGRSTSAYCPANQTPVVHRDEASPPCSKIRIRCRDQAEIGPCVPMSFAQPVTGTDPSRRTSPSIRCRSKRCTPARLARSLASVAEMPAGYSSRRRNDRARARTLTPGATSPNPLPTRVDTQHR